MHERPGLSRRQALGILGLVAASALTGVAIAREETRHNPNDDTPDRPNTPVPSNRAENPSGERLSLAEYTQLYRGYARAVETNYGIDQNVVLAQSYVETGGASSELATEANAFFGIKAKEDWDGPTYTTDSPEEPAGGGEHQDQTSMFRMYETVRDSFLDYGDRITTSGYYDDAVAVRDDPEAYIAAMAPTYATDSKYAEKLLAKYQEILALD